MDVESVVMTANESAQNKQRCRTCLNDSSSSDDFHSLSECLSNSNDKTLADLLLYICHIDDKTLNSFKLPTEICGCCTERLRDAYNFALQAQKVQLDLVAAIKSDIGNKMLDCLVETPIDLPNDPTECLQIKIEEIDVKLQNVFNEQQQQRPKSINQKSTLNANFDIDNEKTKNNYFVEFEMQNIENDCVNFPKAEFITNQENILLDNHLNGDDFMNLDPITIAETHWQSTENEDKYQMDISNEIDNLHETTKRSENQYKKLKLNKSNNCNTRYICDVCGTSFAWKKDLARHMNYHFGDVQFRCEYCDYKFLRRDKLLKHLKTHGVVIKREKSLNYRSIWKFADCLYTEQRFRLIKCTLCEQKFENTNNLRTHINQHLLPNALDFNINNEVLQLFKQTSSSSSLSLSLDDIKANIREDIKKQNLFKFYEIINVNGYEMCLSDSDADVAVANVDCLYKKTKYNCSLCNKDFQRKFQIISHTKVQHTNETLPFKCNVCKVYFVCKKMYESHVNTQCCSKEKKYKCLKCPGKFMWLKNFEAHNCLNNDKKTLVMQKRELRKCKICNETFLWFNDLKRHMQENHNDVDNINSNDDDNDDDNDNDNNDDDIVDDENASHSYSLRKKIMQKQMYANVDIKQKQCTNIVNDNDFYAIDNKVSAYETETETETDEVAIKVVNKKDTMNGKYKCNLCKKRYHKRLKLLQHQKMVHEQIAKTEIIACVACDKKFIDATLLQKHLQNDCRNKMKKFQCDKCAVRFVWERTLKQHMKLKHMNLDADNAIGDVDNCQQTTSDKKLQCDVCDKVFIWPKDLTRHKRIHMPEREKFDCPICMRKFNRKDNMKKHLKVHSLKANLTIDQKEFQQRIKPIKCKGIDKQLCKPNGCKLIQCMICLSKHTKISDLRNHLSNHQNVIDLTKRELSVNALSQLLYPNETIMNEEILKDRIIKDICNQNYDNFYSITNEFGYELNIESSETDSDDELKDDINDVNVGDDDQSTVALELKCKMLKIKQNYKCELCDESFMRKYKLFQHQLLCHEWHEAPHSCVHCFARFLSNDLLQYHYKTQCKNANKIYVCRKCPLRFMWKDNLNTHIRMQHTDNDDIKKLNGSRSFECTKCYRDFQTLKDLTRHFVCHRSDKDLFNCLWCPRKFTRQDNQYRHMIRHGITRQTYETAKCIIKATNTINGTKKIFCKLCNIEFQTIIELRMHLINSHQSNIDNWQNYSIMCQNGFELYIDDSETDVPLDDTITNEIKQIQQRQYTCVICKLICKRKYELAKHQLVMHKPEVVPFKCDKCVFKTVCQDILEHHKKTQCYNEEKKFDCDKCHFKFMWMENLERHQQLLHESNDTTENNLSKQLLNTFIFPCNQCERKYTRRDRLVNHIKKMHTNNNDTKNSQTQCNESQIDPITGEKMIKSTTANAAATEKKYYLCSFCGRALTSSSNLIIHMRRHTGEKPFKCDLCEMAFPRSSDLQCHRRKHTGEKPHKCTVCEKAFSRSYKLQTHMRIHSGERPYKCTYCEKSFTQCNDLTLHIRRHTGERPYVCGICGEGFIQGTALRNHRTLRGHYENVEPTRRTLLQQF